MLDEAIGGGWYPEVADVDEVEAEERLRLGTGVGCAFLPISLSSRRVPTLKPPRKLITYWGYAWRRAHDPEG